MSSNPQRYRLQLTLTERAYGGRRAYEKARRENRTKLDYDSWLLARTPDFKTAFGDWEALRAQCQADAMPPVVLHLSEALYRADSRILREEARSHIYRLAKHNSVATHPALGEVGFSKTKTGKLIHNGATPENMQAALNIIPIIESAHLLGSERSNKPKHSLHPVFYHSLVAKVCNDERQFFVVVTIEETSNGKLFYNNAAVEGGYKKVPAVSPQEQQSEDSVRSKSAVTGTCAKALPPLRRVNPDSVSREIDTGTGEPLREAIERFRRNQHDCPQGGRSAT